ncbi:MAG: 30S ribosomal protein S6 [Candidatus Pacebacteria bacterium CG10_big_fil_rev_8_21_14_0_10_56_10]|nr:MAG: 30S ribosomal protein S6 [Candidatus Pacebacteria bacterium CG10_big_fil_rev_8_21_14_0_10_56_10]
MPSRTPSSTSKLGSTSTARASTAETKAKAKTRPVASSQKTTVPKQAPVQQATSQGASRPTTPKRTASGPTTPRQIALKPTTSKRTASKKTNPKQPATSRSRTATTRQYELTYLVPVQASAELEPLRAQIAQLVTKHRGTVTQTEDWDKHRLAYAINAGGQLHREAIFTHLGLDLSPDRVKTLDKDMTLQPQVIRHLIVTSDGVPSSMAPGEGGPDSEPSSGPASSGLDGGGSSIRRNSRDINRDGSKNTGRNTSRDGSSNTSPKTNRDNSARRHRKPATRPGPGNADGATVDVS